MLPTSLGNGRDETQSKVAFIIPKHSGELEKGPGERLLSDFGAIRPSAQALRGETTPCQQDSPARRVIFFGAEI